MPEIDASVSTRVVSWKDAAEMNESGEIIEPLRDRIVGRVTLEKIVDPFTAETIVEVNEEIDEDKASAVQEGGIEKVKIRSVLTCASRRGVCARCYGRLPRWSSCEATTTRTASRLETAT